MEEIIINKLGPISYCSLEIKDYMIFTGPQASGKSTIAKSIFFFKSLKDLLYKQVNKQYFLKKEGNDLTVKDSFVKEIRSVFLQTFGSTWCMDDDMFVEYHYREGISIRISLKKSTKSPNYVWVRFSKEMLQFLEKYNTLQKNLSDHSYADIKKDIDSFFGENEDIIYIPAGRSMMTLFSTQLMFMYSVMNDDQKRSLDYCTQNYLERIMQLKPYFSNSLQNLIKDKKELSDIEIDEEVLYQCADLMKQILHGEYRNVDGDERLQVAKERYVKINFASSGQQEAIWILNVVFYYLLNRKRSFFIIEEPESHLFPNAQKMIAEFISLAKNGGNKVLLTTHSPYILGTINNMLYADTISKEVDHERLKEILHPLTWITFDKMAAYYVRSGMIESCMDEESLSIDHDIIDGASDEINEDYEKMVDLYFSSQKRMEEE